MKIKKLHKFILSSLVLSSIFLQANTSLASDDNFNVYYYKRVNIDQSYIGSEKKSSEAFFKASNYSSANNKQITSYFIEGNKAYGKDQYGKSNLIKKSFVKVGDKTYYANDDGILLKGLNKIDEDYYYFDDSFNLMKEDWKVLENRLIVANEDGVVNFPANREITIKDIKYKTDSKGYLEEVEIEKQPEDLQAIESTSSLNNNSDPLSPAHKLGLSSQELALVINTAFPDNKLIKDNDPELINGFTETLVELENELGINPFFILGIINAENPILHGKFSNIVKDKNNLMSWTAFDNDPYNSATKFNTYSAAIIYPAKFLSQNYLNPQGKYYVDGSVKGVNKHYATAENWYKNVNYGMKRLNDTKNSLGL
ncbi:MAG: hypothetical protein ACTIH2_07165 [Anaerococcus sp.]